MEEVHATAVPVTNTYAHFWRRFAAYTIDYTIIHVILSPFVVLYIKSSGLWDVVQQVFKLRNSGFAAEGNDYFAIGALFSSLMSTIIIMLAARTVFDMLYFGIWESSKYQATPGKLATHLKVVDVHGNRLSLFHAFGRNFLKIFSNCTFFIGYILAFFTPRRQALHDLISGCCMLKVSHEVPAVPGVEYAGFLRRLIAWILDLILLGLLTKPLQIFLLNDSRSITDIWLHNLKFPTDPWLPTIDEIMHFTLFYVFSILLTYFYYASFESSRIQATPGKIAIGIRVTDIHGQKLSFWMASGRFVARFVTNITLLIGYIMAGFTPKQQALHDELADTLVIKSQLKQG